jgi:MFS family permease
MSTDAPARRRKYPRPSVVTLACVFIAVTAFLTLTDLIEALMNWGTVDMQDALKPALRELRSSGFDPTMPALLAVLRWVGMGMIIFVVATLVFSVYALRGDRSARIFTTVFAVGAGVASVALGPVGVVQAAMLFIAAGALWSPTASRWWRDEPDAVRAAAVAALEPPTPQFPPAPADIAAGPPTGSTTGPTTGPTTGSPPVIAPGTERPASVLTAGLVTILGSLAAAGFALLYLGVYTFARPAYVEAVTTGPFKDMITADELDLVMTVTFWLSIALLPLAATGVLGATALLARRPIGRVTTLVWAWAAAFVGLIMFPVGILATAGAGAVIVLLLREDARSWTGTAE